MTRIIGGTAGGRRLRTPSGDATRPTTDRAREALFSRLESLLGPLDGLRVLDLYAGSGAVGLEALSRGAAVLTAVEHDRRTARLVADNARTLGFRAVEVVALPVARALAEPPRAPYDLVFADPPYDLDVVEVDQVLALLAGHGWLHPDGVLVLERSSRSAEPGWPDGWEVERRKDYGETALWYVRAASPPPTPRQEGD